MFSKCSLVFYFVFGHITIFANADDLFDAVGGMIGLGNNENNNMNIMNPMANNNFQLRSPAFNNNFRPNFGGPPINNNNNRNFGGPPINNNNKNFGLPPVNNNNKNFGGPPVNNHKWKIEPSKNLEDTKNFGLSEDEKLAAEKYPGIKNLLDKLKEINRQREQQKQQENGQNGSNGGTNGGNNNMNNNIDRDSEVAMNGWKILRRRKFIFQAKPVRPDNEIVQDVDKVYYLD